jgi:hypothetical protein
MRYHDANLVGIRMESNSTQAVLSFVREDGLNVDLILKGVKHLRCDNFREGNIVLDVENRTGVKIGRDVVEKAVGVSDGESSQYIFELCAKIESGELVLIQLLESYGTNVVAVCESCEARDNST